MGAPASRRSNLVGAAHARNAGHSVAEGQRASLLATARAKMSAARQEQSGRQHDVQRSNGAGMYWCVKFFTLGRRANTGRPAVFCRFAGCSPGRLRRTAPPPSAASAIRSSSAGQTGGGKFATAVELARAVRATWRIRTCPAFGCGLHRRRTSAVLDVPWSRRCMPGLQIAIETSSTQTPPPGID
jgi:hypothetical protein